MEPAATAPIRPLAWELPYAASAAVKKANRIKLEFLGGSVGEDLVLSLLRHGSLLW